MKRRTKKPSTVTSEPFALDHDFKACLVTASSRLAGRLVAHLGSERVKVKRHLADLVGEKECLVFIVDTRVSDIDLWPGPLLLEPDAALKSWLFLIGSLADASRLSDPPADCAFFERQSDALNRLASYLRKRFDPESRRRFAKVAYVGNARTFVVGMQNGRTYPLKLDDLPESDSSNVVRRTVGKDRHYFRVLQESGNRFDVPWDDVLYHCEPEYEYYKGKEDQTESLDRATRIGGRVRAWRTRRGLSITELAERAGLKRPNLSRLEHGQHLPSLETLERVAAALDLSVAELVAGNRKDGALGKTPTAMKGILRKGTS